MSDRPLVIDGQLLQTSAWGRGMGQYCRSLLKAYDRLYGSENITVIVNKHLPFDKDRASAIKGLLPKARISALDLPTLTSDISNAKHRARRRLDAYLKEVFGDQFVDFIILQLFTFDYCAAFPSRAYKYVVLYDLIPLLHWQDFSKMFAAHMYFPHFTTVIEADTVLVISDGVKDQVVDSFALNSGRVVNLLGATIKRREVGGISEVGINRPFLLMSTADLPHKNNLPAVQAFAEFNLELGNIFQLVITSNMSEDTQRLLKCYSNDLVFVGGVSDEELAYLYKRSLGLFFISSIEGLGLPILEAIEYDKPVVCSAIPVFKEISEEAFYYCDPKNIGSIISALQGLAGLVDWPKKQSNYKAIRQRYTWKHSAEILHETLSTGERYGSSSTRKLVMYIPNPAQLNATIGALVQSLVPAIVQMNPKLIIHIGDSDNTAESTCPFFLPWIAAVQPAKVFNDADRSIYCIDNSAASVEVFRAALLSPGICLYSTDGVNQLIAGLEARGHIVSGFSKASLPYRKEITLGSLLESQGNRAYQVQKISGAAISLRRGDEVLNFSTKYELALWLAECSLEK